MSPGKERPVRPGAYATLFLLFAAVILLTHLPWIGLPYYWDEAGHYVPSALDFYRFGALIARSVEPLIHPPGLSFYLAAIWSAAGFHPESTRCAMLLLAAGALLASLLLAIELLRDAPGMPAFLAVAMVCVSPVFFAQSLLAQPDMPAMLFSTLALWLLLKERIGASAAVCVALVLMKETGAVAPVVFGGWLAYDRRWKDAAWFALPLAVLAAWIVYLAHATGHWAGNEGFLEYNLRYPLNPLRIAVDAMRRVYYFGFANLHWVGWIAIAFAWRTTRLFRSRGWRIAGSFALAHTVFVTLLGGATLERYLLPVLPILYAAMAAGLSVFPRRPRLISSAALVGALVVGIFVNPPYSFPYEDNLAFTDFVGLQRDAADYMDHWYTAAGVTTAWPLTAALGQPDLGYVSRAMRFTPLEEFTPAALMGLDWPKVRVLAVFSRSWDPPLDPLRLAPVGKLWRAIFRYPAPATEEELRRLIPYPAVAHFSRGGQWMDIYVNPDEPLSPAQAQPLVRGANMNSEKMLMGLHRGN